MYKLHGIRYPGVKFGLETYKLHGNVAMTLQFGTVKSLLTVVIGVSESVLPTDDSFKGDWIVSDAAWDETVVFNQNSVDEINMFEY